VLVPTTPFKLGPLTSTNGIQNATHYIGEPNVQQAIRRQRRNNLETMRRFGTPCVVKHMYTIEDVENGIATRSPNYSSVYGQTRHDDPVSHGIGFVSVELSTNEWVKPDGTGIVVANSSPGPGYTQAPRYRGYGPGFLIYAILPDVAEDYFKLSEVGALIKIQSAQVQMGWYPDVSDNDLLTIVEIDRAYNIIETRERFLLKQTNPASIRGLDRRGRKEYTEDFGNRNITDQSFEMTLIPPNEEVYKVEMDR